MSDTEGESHSISTWIKKRANVKGRVTIFKNFIQPFRKVELSKADIVNIKNKFSKFEKLYDRFELIQEEIDILSENVDEQMTERQQFEEQYFELVGIVQLMINDFGDTQSESSKHEESSGHAKLNVKLPTISLPTYDGSYHKWLEYRDTFESLIHKNPRLTDITKLHYLRSSLTSSAALIINAIEITGDNYETAWQLLCDRFDNKKQLIQNHLKELLNYEGIKRESEKALRDLVDHISKHLTCLNNLGEPTEKWDSLIIFIFASKLDSITNRKWEEHKNGIDGIPELKAFIKFLRNYADVLETFHKGTEHKVEQRVVKNVNIDRSHHRSFVASSMQQSANNWDQQCPICNAQHRIFRCEQFINMLPEERNSAVSKYRLCINCLGKGHFAVQCRAGPCRLCKRKHNSLLHMQSTQRHASTSKQSDTNNHTQGATSKDSNSNLSSNPIALSSRQDGQVLLSTALVHINVNGKMHTARALLDCGSQSSFITETFVKKYNLDTQEVKPIKVSGISTFSFECKQRCIINMKSYVNNTYAQQVKCIVVPRITNDLPSKMVNVKELNIPANLKLADPGFNMPAEIDLLLGSDIFWEIIEGHRIPLQKGQPVLQSSKLGWLVAGSIGPVPNTFDNSDVHFCMLSANVDLQKFWQLEEISQSSGLLSEEEEACEAHFVNNTTRLENGKFCVKLPLKQSPEVLGNSYTMCERRLEGIERRFNRQPEVFKLYKEFIDEYASLGHLSVIDAPEVGNYLPHHPVIREQAETTRLRTVFDASAKTSSGISLNDILMVGPVVQSDLLSILIRFRQHSYVFTGDIEKMYRMIEVDPSQRHLQLILWRENNNEQPKCLQLNTVTYGTSSAPYLSTRCLLQLARECTDKDVSQVIEQDFYIDDCLTGSEDEGQLQHVYNTVTHTLESAGFHLRKLRSNSPNLCDSETQKNFCIDETFKTLGMKWQPTLDEIGFSIQHEEICKSKLTKRTILSASSKIFDPLGLLSICTILFKVLMQQLWINKVEWDDPIPNDIKYQWTKLEKGLKHLQHVKIPRHVICKHYTYVQLHTFTDASIKAYAACVYVRSTDSSGHVKTQLLCAKTKVAPVPPPTIPRLELLAAALGANLCNKVRSALRCSIDSCIFWSDSQIVLCWLKLPINKLKLFVANRVKIIKETGSLNWRHVPSAQNPADLASRGVFPENIHDLPLWWDGPTFLQENESEWPVQGGIQTPDLPEVKVNSGQIISKEDDKSDVVDFKRFSKLSKVQRTMAYVNRFLYNCRHKEDRRYGYLTADELNLALSQLVNLAQNQSYKKEISILVKGQKLNSNSSLLPLSPYLDTNSVMRVGGRLENSNYSVSKKHPIILDSKHYFTYLLFEHEHKRLVHAGPQLLLASIREEYWPVGGRILAKTIYRKCMTCRRVKGTCASQMMGNLPKERITAGFPFEVVGTDYAGPFYTASKKGRGSKINKSYLCIFVCFKTKAVHLEPVSDLSAQMYILTLKRFIARRGKPQVIFSDNGKNYVGASREIGRFLQENCDSVSDTMANEGIKFKFSPAYSPHHGGLFEAAVKSAKFHIKRIMINTHLTFEELATIFAQVESILNSRPLLPLSSSPDDYSCLTPGHFLIGRPLVAMPAPPVEEANTSRLERHMRIEQIRQHFWTRWKKEYLCELQQRSKWRTEKRSPQPGQLVLLKEEGVPRMKWHLGRIHRLLPGSDGIARVAEVRTNKGIILRSYERICPLPVGEDEEAENKQPC